VMGLSVNFLSGLGRVNFLLFGSAIFALGLGLENFS